jgi:hypothetical protein
METRYGYCVCGCGKLTNLAPRTDQSRGWQRGKPVAYMVGHNMRGRSSWNRQSDVDYVVDERGCWVWQLYRNQNGYGVTHVDRYPVLAHRHHYERKYGPIPEGLVLDHLCRNRACCNPEHVEPVTDAENLHRGKGTRLNEADIRAILSSRARNVDLAAEFGVSDAHICNIRKGRVWGGLAA